MNIQTIKISHGSVDLKTLYKLSFATLTKFDYILVAVESSEGRLGLGECTALPGYGIATYDEILEISSEASKMMSGLDYHDALRVIDHVYDQSPFVASAIGCAIDQAMTVYHFPLKLNIPLTKTVTSVETAIEAYKEGYTTLKVKVGHGFDKDSLLCMSLFGEKLPVTYRLDANQGYSLMEARTFCNWLQHQSHQVEFLEEPLKAKTWAEYNYLCHESSIPICLDESIFTCVDVHYAKSVGASFIKLKLCKSKGYYDLLNKVLEAERLDLKVVFGNGVSTDVGNKLEAWFYHKNRRLFHGPFEGNGYLKIKESIAPNPPGREGDMLTWTLA